MRQFCTASKAADHKCDRKGKLSDCAKCGGECEEQVAPI